MRALWSFHSAGRVSFGLAAFNCAAHVCRVLTKLHNFSAGSCCLRFSLGSTPFTTTTARLCFKTFAGGEFRFPLRTAMRYL